MDWGNAPGVGARLALRRSRGPLVALAGVHAAFLAAGAAFAHAGVPWVLAQRDAIVGHAQGGATLSALRAGHPWRAAGIDFAANLFLAGVPSALAGISVAAPFPLGAYRAWIGGIVSVDAAHASRLAAPASAAYYLAVVALHTTGFVLCGAGGVRAGLAWMRPRGEDAEGPRWLGIPRAALADMAWLAALAVPFFAAGSLVEFVL